MSSTPYGLAASEWEAELALALAQQVGQIQLAAQVAQMGMAQIVTAHQNASQLSAETLAVADRILQEAVQANRLTPFKEAALQHLRMAYLFEMLSEAEKTGNRIIDVVRR
jgi:hypothetical protein